MAELLKVPAKPWSRTSPMTRRASCSPAASWTTAWPAPISFPTSNRDWKRCRPRPNRSECRGAGGRALLVSLIRDQLGLTGTHIGCDTGQCGACTVHLDGASVKSCSILAICCQEQAVTTIEGVAQDGRLHPMQEAFREHHGLQCGF